MQINAHGSIHMYVPWQPQLTWLNKHKSIVAKNFALLPPPCIDKLQSVSVLVHTIVFILRVVVAPFVVFVIDIVIVVLCVVVVVAA